MDSEPFSRYLRRLGKKDQVVAGLVRQVQAFEAYLVREHGRDLASATAPDVEQYAALLETLTPGRAGKQMRALALYYKFVANAPLAAAAAAIREQEVAGNRRACKLRDLRGVDAGHLACLAAVGITDVDQMLAAGRTAEQRRELSRRAGLPEDAVLELAKLSDLARLPGVKGIRARLYYDAGIDSVAKLATCEPEALYAELLDYVNKTGFDGIAPLRKEVTSTIATARALPKTGVS